MLSEFSMMIGFEFGLIIFGDSHQLNHSLPVEMLTFQDISTDKRTNQWTVFIFYLPH